MSDKGRRSRAWDDKHLTGAWTPIRWLIRAFSSITLAVILLVLVALYGVSASVPVGLMVMGLTYGVYALTLLACIAAVAGLPAWATWRVLRGAGEGKSVSSGLRFAATLATFLLLAPAASVLWYRFLWPSLHYDPLNEAGLMLFADFVKDYRSITLRRLPGVEMSELEYYSWWPLRLVLMLFVVNMVTATVRRIEFNFKNIGVLTVHTGIVVIALGSVYYNGLKLEGDTILIAGERGGDGMPTLGPAQESFFDNTDVSLYVSQGAGWEQRLMRGVPRYNDYALDAFAGESALELARRERPWMTDGPARSLSLPIDAPGSGLVDDDIRLRVVGYAHYATLVEDWVREDAPPRPMPEGLSPLRFVYVHSALHTKDASIDREAPTFAFKLPVRDPKGRVAIARDGSGAAGSEHASDDQASGGHATGRAVMSVEYTLAMDERRWRDLASPLPEGSEYGLSLEVQGERVVIMCEPGASARAGGVSIRVKSVTPEPPFPIITKGYENASSAVAVVEVTDARSGEPRTYERFIYHRYPELNQDVAGTRDDGRPNRGPSDATIGLSLIAADHLAIYIDEPAPAGAGSASTSRPSRLRAIIREPGGRVRVIDDVSAQSPRVGANATDLWIDNFVDKLALRVGEGWEHAQPVGRPRPVPASERENSDVGTHNKALLAVEVTSTRPSLAGWKRVAWIPFSRYVGAGLHQSREIALPDGRTLELVFGRLQHRFTGFAIQLVDFEMISYDHRGAPRDFQSIVRVSPVSPMGRSDAFEAYEHVTKLNAPLRAPFMWMDERGLASNLAQHLAWNLSPHYYKLSQAGWDQAGWRRTQAQADAGLIPRPFAQFTILGVGNNPGIHVIALGGVLMGLGIPWAFYVKPWLVRREKRAWQEKARLTRSGSGARESSGATPRPLGGAKDVGPKPAVGATPEVVGAGEKS